MSYHFIFLSYLFRGPGGGGTGGDTGGGGGGEGVEGDSSGVGGSGGGAGEGSRACRPRGLLYRILGVVLDNNGRGEEEEEEDDEEEVEEEEEEDKEDEEEPSFLYLPRLCLIILFISLFISRPRGGGEGLRVRLEG